VKINYLKLIASIIIPYLAWFLGSLATSPAIPNWYAGLQKPWFNPPNWLFAPVWITLYALMGIALYLVWMQGWENKNVKRGFYIFGFQLALNALWSIIFFGMQAIFAAFVLIVVLWLVIAFTIIQFYKVSKNAAYLLVPYIVWVTIATALNYSIWVLN
jgi:benzodiazapine receptor